MIDINQLHHAHFNEQAYGQTTLMFANVVGHLEIFDKEEKNLFFVLGSSLKQADFLCYGFCQYLEKCGYKYNMILRHEVIVKGFKTKVLFKSTNSQLRGYKPTQIFYDNFC